MVALVLGMLICVGLAVAIVAIVAVPARRDGRDVLSPRGEEVVTALKERTESAKARFDRSDSAEDSPSSESAAGETATAEGEDRNLPTAPTAAGGDA
jgi:hypothetical protein